LPHGRNLIAAAAGGDKGRGRRKKEGALASSLNTLLPFTGRSGRKRRKKKKKERGGKPRFLPVSALF